MARERRLFSEEFKREAVKLVGQPGASKAAIARDLGIGALLDEVQSLDERLRRQVHDKFCMTTLDSSQKHLATQGMGLN